MVKVIRIPLVRRTSAVLAVILVAGVPILAQSRLEPLRTLPAPNSQAAQTPALETTLSLSMEQAVAMALETNLGLKSERLNLDIASQNIASARAAFMPFLSSNLSRNTTQSAPQTFENGTTAVGSTNFLSASGSFREALPWYGSAYSVVWSGNRNASVGGNSTFNPRLGSTFSVNFTQPLWRGFQIDSSRFTLDSNQRQRQIADLQLQAQIVQTDASVRLAYLNLIASIEGRKVSQGNYDLNQKQLDNSKARVAVGQAADIDIIQAQASVASSLEQVIVSEANVSGAEDGLRSLILDHSRPDYWSVHIEARDSIAQPESVKTIDVEATIKNALANRLDLQEARRNLEISDLGLKFSEDLAKTQVDFVVNYQASGTGGTLISEAGNSVKAFGSVLSEAFGGAYPSWTVGVNVSHPLGRSANDAAIARGQLQRQQQDLAVRQLEINITNAVRQAARDVDTNFKRVQATAAAKIANERQLDAEQRKLAVGMATTFDVLLKQSLLATATTNWLNAIIFYNRSLIQLERIQKIQ